MTLAPAIAESANGSAALVNRWSSQPSESDSAAVIAAQTNRARSLIQPTGTALSSAPRAAAHRYQPQELTTKKNTCSTGSA